MLVATGMSASTPQNDNWITGAPYDHYVGRWSRLVAREFLAWLDIPPGRRWLDIGCGTGALTGEILNLASPSEITGVDSSEGFVAHAREQIRDERVRFEVSDAQALPFEAAAYNAAVSGLVLNFVPEPARAVSEMARVTRPAGTVAAYVWDYAGRMEMLRHFWDAAAALDAAALELDEGRRFPLCNPEPLKALFRACGLHDVEVRAIDIPTTFRDFEDYWTPFLGGQGPAPGYAVSLSEVRRVALREQIRARLPIAPDGSVRLTARAWAVRGIR